MAHFRLAALDFAGASLLEALFRARMCFQLGHSFSRFGRGPDGLTERLARQGFPPGCEALISIQEIAFGS
jgi:hypothetical protein